MLWHFVDWVAVGLLDFMCEEEEASPSVYDAYMHPTQGGATGALPFLFPFAPCFFLLKSKRELVDGEETTSFTAW